MVNPEESEDGPKVPMNGSHNAIILGTIRDIR